MSRRIELLGGVGGDREILNQGTVVVGEQNLGMVSFGMSTL